MALRTHLTGVSRMLQRRPLTCAAVARPAGLPHQQRAKNTTARAAASSMAVGLGSLASVDGAAVPSNSLNNNFNAAVDLSSLFGGYQKIGAITGSVFTNVPSTPPAQPTQSFLEQPCPATAQTLSPSPTPALTHSPSSRGRKKALLIACSYPGTKAQLRGPANDIQCMQYLLTSRFGFSPSQIVVLRDDDYSKGRDFIPFRDVIMRACSWLVADAKPGDSLFFHYSGHGGSMKDPTYQEDYDGTLLPTDFKQAGQIRDTELARLMVHPLPPGVVLHALFDSCHSGTMLDLPYDTRLDKAGNLQNWRRTNMRGTAGGTVVQLGACDDRFTAADTAKLSATAYTGAATFSFIESIERYGTQQSYATLLLHMTQTLKSLGKTSVKPQSAGGALASGALPLVGAIALGPLGLLAGCALGTSLDVARMQEQVPVLACDRPLNLHATALMI